MLSSENYVLLKTYVLPGSAIIQHPHIAPPVVVIEFESMLGKNADHGYLALYKLPPPRAARQTRGALTGTTQFAW